jgi:hypothetical protein
MYTDMKTTHTPGPWLARISTPEQESEKWGGDCGANACIVHKTGKYIMGVEMTDVIVFLPHWRDNAQNVEQIANARLIAAAPELLEALKYTLDAMRDLLRQIPNNEGLADFNFDQCERVELIATNIISKAEGHENKD